MPKSTVTKAWLIAPRGAKVRPNSATECPFARHQSPEQKEDPAASMLFCSNEGLWNSKRAVLNETSEGWAGGLARRLLGTLQSARIGK